MIWIAWMVGVLMGLTVGVILGWIILPPGSVR